MKMKLIYLLFFMNLSCIYAQNTAAYNSQKAVEYAEKWWNGRNKTDYNDYGIVDCANFVSQCLIAGGLDLTKGTDGKRMGVDSWNCIPEVQNLVTHLKNYQQTEYYMTTTALGGTDVLKTTDAGDPVFVGDATKPYAHSLFCTSVVGTGNLYSSHSSDYHNEPYTFWNHEWAYYFHIKSSIPDHCSNCKLDGDETDIDCGGSCPPCQKAKSSVNYNYNIIFLPQTTRAIGTIMAGNADVHVLPGQDVTFISAGEIILKPGFHVHKGASFHGERKAMRKDIGADCGEYCLASKANCYCRSCGDYFSFELVNASNFYVVIYQYCQGNHRPIYEGGADIITEGVVNFWDLRTGIINSSLCITDVFWYDLTITSCDGNKHSYYESITIRNNCQKSLHGIDSVSHTDENIDKIKRNKIILYPNPNSGSFTIGINDIQEIQQIQVFNPIGQMVYSVQNPDNNKINLPAAAKGTFFVKIITQTETVIKKIIIE